MKPLESIGEQISVDTSQVDRIGGAGPEPEERPAFVTTTIDPTSGDNGGVPAGHQQLILKQAPTVRQEYTVDELARFLGKSCGNCKHFNHAFGQRLIEHEMQTGAPETIDRWNATIAELAAGAINGELLSGDEIVSDPFAPTPAEKQILRMGICTALSSAAPDDNTFVHPDLTCASAQFVGETLFAPKDNATERSLEQQRSALLNAANVNQTPWWKRIKFW